MGRADPVFVSWIGYHGRSAGIAHELGIESFFVDGGEGNVVLRYARQWSRTVKLLRGRDPRSVIVMQPPLPALLCVALCSRGSRIIGDLHTGTFVDPKWTWSTSLVLRVLRRRGAAIVTGDRLADRCRREGVDVFVLHDLVQPLPLPPPAQAGSEAGNTVLVPLAYAFDEPVQEILDAARNVPHVNWVLTGKAPTRLRSGAPENVSFSGFVSNEDYAALLGRASVVVALTTEEDTMQRAGYEALAAGKPLVTSSTDVLKEFFGDAAVYVSPSAPAIAEGVVRALEESDGRSAAMAGLRDRRVSEQDEEMRALRRALSIPV